MILSAHHTTGLEIMMKNKRDQTTRFNNPLMKAFGFEMQDLMDNKSGFISFRQKDKLKRRLFFTTLFIIFMIGLAALWVVVFGILAQHTFFTSENSSLWDKVFTVGGFLFALGMTLLGFIAFFETWQHALYEFRHGTVDTVQGVISKHRYKSKQGLELWIIIDNQRFDVGYNQHKELKEKESTLYITPKTRKILSVEQ
jgi:hypothetical protein